MDPIWIAKFELKQGHSIWVRDFSIESSNTTTGPGVLHAGTRQHVREIVEGLDDNFWTEHTEDHIIEAINVLPYIFVMENYELSARLAHYWLHVTKRDIQAIMYSSNKDYSQYNLAIHPQVIEERFMLESVTKCFYDSNTGTATFDKEAQPSPKNDSLIEWQDCRHWGTQKGVKHKKGSGIENI